ncbi:MAG: O-antigen ligase family protein [Chloroflexaceae bacterium]|nr:O-antigen ligase family protein [Chloroflexaceae bacterium]
MAVACCPTSSPNGWHYYQHLRLFDVRSVEVTPENFSVVERMALLQAGWQMFLHEPVTGVGPGNYPIAYAGSNSRDPYLLHPWYYPHQHAHNYYLHMAAEAGIIGAIAYLVLLALVCAQAFFSLLRVRGWFWQGITVGRMWYYSLRCGAQPVRKLTRAEYGRATWGSLGHAGGYRAADANTNGEAVRE